MSVLLGERFAEIGRILWGEDWKARGAERLDRSARQLLNIENGTSNVRPALKRELLQLVREQVLVLEAVERELAD